MLIVGIVLFLLGAFSIAANLYEGGEQSPLGIVLALAGLAIAMIERL